MTKQEIIEELRLSAVKHGENAEWYKSFFAIDLFEVEMFIKRTLFDAIDIIDANDPNTSQEKIDSIRYNLFNEYKNLQQENFIDLANMCKLKYLTLSKVNSLLYKFTD